MRRGSGIAAYPTQDWSMAARYGWALGVTLVAFGVTVLLLGLSTAPIYAPLVGAVGVSAWLGGAGPALASTALGWALALLFLATPRWEAGFANADELTRWLANLVVALVMVGIAVLLRTGRARATQVAAEATSTLTRVEALQELSAALAAASTSSEVARAVAGHAGPLLGASDATLVVLDGEELVAVEPGGSGAAAESPARRLPLAGRTVLAAAAAERVPVRVDTRLALEAYPDTLATVARSVHSAVAVPLVVGDGLLGALGFLFERPRALDDEGMSLATTAAGLAAQALERARLYESEREFGAALERILDVAPRFHADSEDAVTEAICREARATFGADYGVLWRLRDGTLELLRSYPAQEAWPPGLELPLTDFPGLEEAVDTLGVSFVPDVLAEARDEGLARVRQFGIRSSLRTPVVISGRTELVLVVSWQTVVSPPDPSIQALARRFADQAGLAFEQLERRRAEERAAERADQTARLQEVTAALSLAATRGEVGDTCLEHALRFVGAEAGFVVLSGPGGSSVQLISQSGYSEEALEAWRSLGLDADVPYARAIASGEPVWALTREEMDAFADVPLSDDQGWVTIPLKTPSSVHGALHVSLPRPLDLDAEARGWLQSVVSQCALALERSMLYEREQRLREQSERLQELTARTSEAMTTTDVARIAVAVVRESTGAESAVLWELDEEHHAAHVLAADPSGSSTDGAGPAVERTFGRIAAGRSGWRETDLAGGGVRIRIPLVSGRTTLGGLELDWDAPLDEDLRGFVEALAGQAAQALDRARHLEAERSIAETLQRSVLPASLPSLPGLELAARYLPGTKNLDVGGDWFDALELPDGRVGLVVGDVVGKGIQAAANMGQLRNALRALSVERLKPPSALQRLDRLSDDVLETTFATVFYAVVDREAGVMRYSSAGHPPPVVACPDGRVLTLEDGRGLPLGTGLRAKYRQGVVELPAGSTVVLYTDGLVERRGASIDEGIGALRDVMRDGPTEAALLLEHILERLGTDDRGDDIAIIAARICPVAPLPLDLRVLRGNRALQLVRTSLRTWMQGTSLDTAESEELLLATWEICANAMEHADEPTEPTIRVHAACDAASVRIVVEDSGRYVPATSRVDRGLGLRLAGALASSLDVAPSERGTRVTLERSLPAGRPARRSEEPDEQQDDDDERE